MRKFFFIFLLYRGNEESLSIEETNKLRAALGLAPLEVGDGLSSKEENKELTKDGGKIFVEDGMEFVHKAPQHIGDKKREEDLKEKLEVFSFVGLVKYIFT